MAFESTPLACSAARLTDLCSDQATIILQAKTENSRNPSAAPTAMKNVPSGSDDFFIYGAPAVGGTVGSGYATVVVSFGIGGGDDPSVDVDVAVEASVLVGVSDVEVLLVVKAGGFSVVVFVVFVVSVVLVVLSVCVSLVESFGLGLGLGLGSVVVVFATVVVVSFAGAVVFGSSALEVEESCAEATITSKASSKKNAMGNFLSFMGG